MDNAPHPALLLYVINVIQSSYAGTPTVNFERYFDTFPKQLAFLKVRVEQQFLCDHPEEKRARMRATIDFLQSRV